MCKKYPSINEILFQECVLKDLTPIERGIFLSLANIESTFQEFSKFFVDEEGNLLLNNIKDQLFLDEGGTIRETINDIETELRPDDSGDVRPGSVLDQINKIAGNLDLRVQNIDTIVGELSKIKGQILPDEVGGNVLDGSILDQIIKIETELRPDQEGNVKKGSVLETINNIDSNLGTISGNFASIEGKLDSLSANAEPNGGNCNGLISGDVDGSKHLLQLIKSQVEEIEAKLNLNMKKVEAKMDRTTKKMHRMERTLGRKL